MHQNRSFAVDAWLALFWRDPEFTLSDFRQKVDEFEPTELSRILDVLRNLSDRLAPSDEEKKGKSNVRDDENGDAHENEQKALESEDEDNGKETERRGNGFPIEFKPNMQEDHLYINLTEFIEIFKAHYMFPLDNLDCPFTNIEGQKVEYAGGRRNAKELVYNVNEKVFKLHLHFTAKLTENFENTDNEFPFEWQFLNMQFPYKLRSYILIL